MSKTIEQRAREYVKDFVQPYRNQREIGYIQGATEQKSIDDEEHRKDMRDVGVKREELIDKVLDTTIQYLQDHLIDVVLVGEDKQSCAWGYRIHNERIKYDVKQQINKILNE